MQNDDLWPKIEALLPHVSRPSSYIDHELNAVRKRPGKDIVKVALAYPDKYEVGLPNLGLQILYERINERQDALCDRVYAPALDLDGKLREAGVPLFSWELNLPVADFDAIGFTLQSELNYTNVLNMLDLADVALRSQDRSERDPLVLAGGPLAFNPEPLAPFLDAVVIGDGEEVIGEIIDLLKESRGAQRATLLRALANLEGVYVPSLYKAEYEESGSLRRVFPVEAGVAENVRARIIPDLDAYLIPQKPLVPLSKVVHNRAVAEIMRGCTRGCRFCMAGYIYRPVREREPKRLLDQVTEVLKNSGFSEISLLSLSTADYTGILPLARSIMEAQAEEGISLSLPSLRLDSFSVDLAAEVSRVKKTGLTFALEAGSQRLRDVINKGVTDEDFLTTVSRALGAGWSRLKLYFMIGLPTENWEDVEAIVSLVGDALRVARQVLVGKEARRLNIVVNVASFVPKPHTPFQWVAQDEPDSLARKVRYLKKAFSRERAIVLRWHSVEMSLVEALLGRGDRRVSAVLERAWRLGARFDQWTEHFDFGIWEQALADERLQLDFYSSRERSADEVFPWEHLGSGVSREFLWREYQAALGETLTGDCRFSACPKCGLCPAFGVSNRLAEPGDPREKRSGASG